jgi:hypothetical protein
MVFQVNSIPEKYITLGVELPRGCDTCTGTEYRGSKSLVEYIVGDSVMDVSTNGTDLYGVARVVTIFKRRWIYHLITVFLQSILLNCLSYMTFFFKLYNFQDRIMITITIMTILATIQSSINKLVPKTAYLKMIDIWLIYSFNINILIMVFHISLDNAIPRDEKTGLALNPMLRGAEGQDIDDIDIKLFRNNPDLDPGWVHAYR